MSELSTNKIKPVTQNTLTLGDSGDSIVLGTGATAVGFGSSPVTEDPNDPAADTNPADGVGALWLNTTSGCLFSCTDATTDDNVWINTANCTNNNIPNSNRQGTISGFVSGGTTSGVNRTDVIDKFSFASDGNAIGHGTLSLARGTTPSGTSSATHGYSAGGSTGPGGSTSNGRIDKFLFTTENSITIVGDLFFTRAYTAGHSSDTHGYASSGSTGFDSRDQIDKYSFSSDGNATEVGQMTTGRHTSAGQNSETHGYTSGGFDAPTNIEQTTIDRFTFVSDNDSTGVGDLAVARYDCAGNSSITDGYTSGGSSTNSTFNIIEKFPFASSSVSFDHNDLSSNLAGICPQNSTTHGYVCGGQSGNDAIEKFSFSNNNIAVDIGNLSLNRFTSAGQQY